MPDTFLEDWGLSSKDMPAPPDVGVGPTKSFDNNRFGQEWLGESPTGQKTVQTIPITKSPGLTWQGLQSVFTDPAKRAKLAETPIGGLVSLIAQGLTAPGQALKSTEPISTSEMIGPAANLASIIGTGGIPTVGAKLAPLIDPATASLAQLARDKFGIPLRGGQISESRAMNTLDSVLKGRIGSGYGKNIGEQYSSFNRSIANTIGEDAEKVTPEVMQNAKERLGQNYEDIAASTTLKFDRPLNEALTAISDNTKFLQKEETGVINKHINHIIDIASKNDQQIAGKDYRELIKTGSPLDLATKSSNSNIAHYAGEIKDALIGALDRHAPEDMKVLLKQTNSQYKAMKTIEPLVAKSPTGDISPALLMNQVRMKYGTMAYGGGGDLAELARIGQRFLKEPPNSFTADRQAMQKLLGAGGLGLADIGVGAFYDPVTAMKLGAIGTMLGAGKLGANAIIGKAMRSPAYAERLINRSLPSAGTQPNLLKKLTGGDVNYLPPGAAALPVLPFMQTAQ